MLKEEQVVPAFSAWGFRQKGNSGNQLTGECPFCGKLKFYINEKSSLWDCKVCGLRGNYFQYLQKISERNQQTPHLDALAKDRKLPRIAFVGNHIGFYNGTYSIPIYNEFGKLQDLRRFKLSDKTKASIGCKTGLWGIQHLKSNTTAPVYLCEGEWDGIAFQWLLKHLGKPGVVVAVPGANTFKDEWVAPFKGRNVFVCYDNDKAGAAGEVIVENALRKIAKNLHYVNWPKSTPSGYDIRDLVSEQAFKKKKPKACWKTIQDVYRSTPRLSGDVAKSETAEQEVPEKIKIERVFEAFHKWLYLKDTKGIEIMLATVISNEIEGDPVWMFLVAPPGSAKTEVIQTLNGSNKVHFTSRITPHSLISGFALKGGDDPSLIPKIIGKTLSIKDFTTIMDTIETERREIFNILRDSYDGSCSRSFGNGITRAYTGKFGVIAAVTTVIYSLDDQNQSLGERFLKFCTEPNLEHAFEDKIIERAISNINKETNMRDELLQIVKKFLDWKFYEMGDFKNLPTIPDDIKSKIISLVKFGSRMRGVVPRDRYRSEIISAKPSSEVGSRLGKQVTKLAQSLAIINGRKEVTEHEYGLIKKCVMDTISQKTEDIIQCLYEKCPTENDSINTKVISGGTKYPQSTILRVLQNFTMLEIVKRIGGANKAEWSLTQYARDLIKKAEVYPSTVKEPIKVKKEKSSVAMAI